MADDKPNPNPGDAGKPADQPGGSSSLIADLETVINAPAPADAGGEGADGGEKAGAAAPAKPGDAGAKPGEKPAGGAASAKPDDKNKPAPAKPGAPATGGQPQKPGGPVELRKELETVRGEKKTLETTIAELQRKTADYEKRRWVTPEMETAQQAIQKRLEGAEGQLYAVNYQLSPEFKAKFEKPFKAREQEAIGDIKSLKVIVKGAEGENPTERDATIQDWLRVYDAPNNASANRIARELFGEDANLVIGHRTALQQIQREANQAVADKRNGFATESQKAVEQMQQQTGEFNARVEHYKGALAEKYPDHFGMTGKDPESDAAYKRGLEYIEKAMKSTSPDDRARHGAVIASWAAAYPRLVGIIRSREEKIGALEAELGKLRKSDPGNGGEGAGGGGGGEGGSDEPKGSDAMADMLEKMK